MILILKLDLDMVKMYHHAKNKVSRSMHSKVVASTDKQTDTHTHAHARTQYENITLLHMWAVIIITTHTHCIRIIMPPSKGATAACFAWAKYANDNLQRTMSVTIYVYEQD